MGTLQEALTEALQPGVGYKPTPKRKERRQVAAINRLVVKPQQPQPTVNFAELFEKLVEDVISPIRRPRTIQVTEQGGFYRARFDGEAISCFGNSPTQATKKLKYFSENREVLCQ